MFAEGKILTATPPLSEGQFRELVGVLRAPACRVEELHLEAGLSDRQAFVLADEAPFLVSLGAVTGQDFPGRGEINATLADKRKALAAVERRREWWAGKGFGVPQREQASQ